MERGFLSSGKKDKDNVAVRGGLAKQVKDIEGKVLGRDGKPLKSILKRPKVVAANVHSDRTVEDLQYPNVHLKSSATMDGGNMQDSVPVANMEHDDAFNGIAGTSCTDRPKTQEESVSENAHAVPKRINFRSLVNEERVSNHDTVLPKAAKESVMSRYANTLVGYFVGKSLAFQIVQNYVNNTWAKFGLSKLMKMDNGMFLFKFDIKSGMDQVIERGPWLIRNTPLILTKWKPNVSLKPGVVTKVPVWVKLYNVLVVAYSEDGLSLIATQIGKPIMLDAFTSSMCVDSWGRISFARALIEIDAKSDLKREVKMAILVDEDDGSGHISEGVAVKKSGTNTMRVLPRPINKKANDKQDKKKPADVNASSSNTLLSNAFSVLNLEEGADCGDQFPTNDVGSVQKDKGVQNPILGTEEAVVECEKDSLWAKFKAAKEASKSNPKSTSNYEEESDEDEVYFPNEEYTFGLGGGFSLEDDDLDCYDGYEAQVFDMPGPSPQPQALATTFEARVRDYMAAHSERMERFENVIFKQREEIKDRMTKMFGLLKEHTTSRALEKVLIREESKFPVTKNVNSISLAKGEEEGSDKTNETLDNTVKPTAEREEVKEVLSSRPVEYYLKHMINEKLIEGLVDNNRFNDSLSRARVGKVKGKTYNVLPWGPVYEAILKKKITKKEDVEGNFEIPCSIGGLKHVNALVNQGSDVNVMPYSTYMKLTDEMLAETDIRLSLASHSYIYPLGIAEDVLVEVVEHVYPIDFVILDIKENEKRPFILGTPFLKMAKAAIKFNKGTITLRFGKSKISFHRIPDSPCITEKGVKNDIEPIAPTMTVNRLVLEWEEKIKLHLEREMEFNQWRSKKFKSKHPTLITTKGGMDDEGEVSCY
ncbi:MAK10-like protein [Tanacetum coccineum]